MVERQNTLGAQRVLVLGGSGMLGSAILRELRDAQELELHASVRNPDALPADIRQSLGPRLRKLDVLDDEARRRLFSECQPDLVVNAVGVVKQAPQLTHHISTVRLNALLPHILAQECGNVGARLVHVSTDCVFSGRRGAYQESDIPDPIDFYGRSKLLGEIGEPHVTIRTSIIGPELTRHASLLDWFLTRQGQVVHGFSGAIYSGVTTVEFASFLRTVLMAHSELAGVFQLASEPISKYDLLHLIANTYGWTGKIVRDADFQCDRSMSGDLIAEHTGYRPPPWPEMISNMWSAQQAWTVDAKEPM